VDFQKIYWKSSFFECSIVALELLVTVTGGIAYLTLLADWRDRRRQDSKKKLSCFKTNCQRKVMPVSLLSERTCSIKK